MSVRKDIFFASVKDSEQRNYFLDLYLPEEEINSADDNTYSLNFEEDLKGFGYQANETRPHGIWGKRKNQDKHPVVIFIHGGGWRRGGRDAWKHYLFYDVNFFVSLCLYVLGTYGNIGHALSSSGIGCAVISYPLTEVDFVFLSLELILSYFQSCGVIFIFSIPFLSGVENRVCSVSFIYKWFLLVMLTTNLVTILLFCIKRKEFKISIMQTRCLLFAVAGLFATARMCNTQYQFELATTLTFLLSQSIILIRRRPRCGNTYEHQVSVVSQAVRWIKRYAEESDRLDPSGIYVMGHSAGGHLASLISLDRKCLRQVGCSTNDIKGVISVSGVYHLPCLERTLVRQLYLIPTFGKCTKKWLRASPLHLLQAGQTAGEENTPEDGLPHEPNSLPKIIHIPKFLLFSAERDLFLKPQSIDFHNGLLNVGVKSFHVEIKGANHFSIISKLNCGNFNDTVICHIRQFVKHTN